MWRRRPDTDLGGRPFRPLLRTALAGALIAVLTATATAALVLGEVHKATVDLAQSPRIVAPGELTPDQAGAPQTILIVGSDKRALSKVAQDRAAGVNTDTMMLLRMDPGRQQTSVLSIPRDLLVTIHPDKGPPVTTKINAAYAMGGDRLMLRTIRQTLHVAINHVVDINFEGFQRVVDAIGCVYVDVDHRYFHSNAGLPPSLQYSEINLRSGYQRVCGQAALSYVRYRHTDSDLVRAARQQDFLRDVKDQIGLNGLFARRAAILRAAGRSVETDIRGTPELVRMAKLVAFSLGRPIRQVPFRYDNAAAVIGGVDYVTASHADIRASVADLLSRGTPTADPAARTGRASRGHRHARVAAAGAPAAAAVAPSPTSPRDTTPTAAGDRAAAARALSRVPFRASYPRLQLRGATQENVRAYTLRDEHGGLHHAYRIVWSLNAALGEYYGIEGTDWQQPPIVAHPTRTVTVAARTLLLFEEGGHLRLVAWHAGGALYWLANTLTDDISNRDMLALATSAAG